MIANAISFSAAISACEKVEQWEQALALLHNMRETGLTAYVIRHTASSAVREGKAVGQCGHLSAREKGEQWQQALPLFHKMRKTDLWIPGELILGSTWAPRAGQQGPSWPQVGFTLAPGPVRKGIQKTCQKNLMVGPGGIQRSPGRT